MSLSETSIECDQKVLQLLETKLKLNIKTEDIEAVHHLSRRETGKKTPRDIIICFIFGRIRDEVLYMAGNLRGTGIILVQDLTLTTHHLRTK